MVAVHNDYYLTVIVSEMIHQVAESLVRKIDGVKVDACFIVLYALYLNVVRSRLAVVGRIVAVVLHSGRPDEQRIVLVDIVVHSVLYALENGLIGDVVVYLLDGHDMLVALVFSLVKLQILIHVFQIPKSRSARSHRHCVIVLLVEIGHEAVLLAVNKLRECRASRRHKAHGVARKELVLGVAGISAVGRYRHISVDRFLLQRVVAGHIVLIGL